jgi:hypothetical protein
VLDANIFVNFGLMVSSDDPARLPLSLFKIRSVRMPDAIVCAGLLNRLLCVRFGLGRRHTFHGLLTLDSSARFVVIDPTN